MKKTILIAGIFLFFGIAPHVLAEGFVALAPIPGLTDTSALSAAKQTNLASFFNSLYKFAIGMAAVLAVIQIIWGGVEIAINKDNVSKIIDSKGRILQAVLGLVLVLSPVLVFSIINPNILNLSINLERLDTRSRNSGSSQTQGVTLSDTELQLRESGGGTVESAFTITGVTTPREIGQRLDAKQAECTQRTGGLGVVLPAPQASGGGVNNYVCQTCPPNTSPRLLVPGPANASARGSCQPN